MRRTCLDMVFELAKKDPRVVFVGSDLGPGVLDQMKTEMPERFYMEGVSEQAIIGIAAGLAMEGFIPYVNTIATFITRRCFEQVAVDLCLHDLPVRLIANGGGLVYAPLGPTHLAIEDVGILRPLPNMTIVAPSDASEMRRFMETSLDCPHPIYIRLGKGGDPVIDENTEGFEIGKGYILREGNDVVVFSTGVMTGRVLTAAEELAAQGIDCRVVHLPTIKPLDDACILSATKRMKAIVTVEEHTRIGGLGSAIVELLSDQSSRALPNVTRIGLPDTFPTQYGSQDSMMDFYGLQPPELVQTIERAISHKATPGDNS